MLITANDFGTIFLAIELQSLSLYMLAGFKKNSIYSIESGLKYFILGALSAAYFLLGWSLLYGISGLFILVNFHFFFFNVLSAVNNKNENNFTEYKTGTEYKPEEDTLLPKWANLFTNSYNNGSNEILDSSLLIFSPNFKIIVKVVELFCCDSCYNLKESSSKNERLSLGDEILKLYDSQKLAQDYEKQHYIPCDFCRNYVESFNFEQTTANQISINKNDLQFNLEKGRLVYQDPAVIETNKNSEKGCWFCDMVIENYKETIEEEKRRTRIKTKKMLNIYEKGLSPETFATYRNFLEEYYKQRNELLSNRLNKDLFVEELFKTCSNAEDFEKQNIPVCQGIIKRFDKAWEVEGLRSLILANKMKKTCEKLKNMDQPSKMCKALERLSLFIETNDKKTTNCSITKTGLIIELNDKSYINHCDNPKLKAVISAKNNFIVTKIEKSEEIRKNMNLSNKKKEIEIKKITNNQFKRLTNKTNESKLVESSLTLILISFFFKLAVAPFHLWSLDVYEGSLTSSTIFFAVVTKFSVIVILIKICYYGFYSLLKSSLYQSIILVAVSSILVGSIAGLTERKLKSLLAYSSINNIGYILLALTIGTLNGIKTTIFYLIIYISSSLAAWSGLISIQLQKNRYIKKQNKEFGDIIMLRKTNPILTITLQIALFSTAGLPPFIGFLTKMSVFITSIESHLFLVSLITILLSIMSTFYYLRLVKIMCFEKILVGKLYKPMRIKQSTVNAIFSFFLPYQFFKPWLSVFFSYKVVIS
jgi:NADH:ubiquinone oxidoreductase subunit 2 (subunit N)